MAFPEVQSINLNYIFTTVQWIISSAYEAGTIAYDFIWTNGEGDKLANLIYRDQKKAEEAAHIISEVAKLKSAYFGS